MIRNYNLLMKIQIPNPKSQVSNNFQSLNSKFQTLAFENWNLFGI